MTRRKVLSVSSSLSASNQLSTVSLLWTNKQFDLAMGLSVVQLQNWISKQLNRPNKDPANYCINSAWLMLLELLPPTSNLGRGNYFASVCVTKFVHYYEERGKKHLAKCLWCLHTQFNLKTLLVESKLHQRLFLPKVAYEWVNFAMASPFHWWSVCVNICQEKKATELQLCHSLHPSRISPRWVNIRRRDLYNWGRWEKSQEKRSKGTSTSDFATLIRDQWVCVSLSLSHFKSLQLQQRLRQADFAKECVLCHHLTSLCRGHDSYCDKEAIWPGLFTLTWPAFLCHFNLYSSHTGHSPARSV